MIDKQAEIYRCGKKLFEEKGFKDTNVAEIMQLTGFATGTFYRYYASKDQLFMEIYGEENVALKRAIMATIDFSASPLAIMQDMLRKNLEGMKANPILREWYNRESFGRIERNFRENNALAKVDFLYDSFLEVVRDWQQKGLMRADLSVEMIMAIFSALVNMDLHKEEIGLMYFPELMEHMTAFVMQGLLPGQPGGGAHAGGV